MIPFAVHHEGMPDITGPDGKPVPGGRWVLDVQAERALLYDDDTQAFYWRDLADCKLVRIQTPDMPSIVVPVQPQPQAPGQLVTAPALPRAQAPGQLVTAPALPRAERRAQAFGR